jgi:ribonuclease D
MDLITTTSELAAVCTRLAKHPVITVDTEFLRETTYYPLLCVVQMASAEEAVVVDTLAASIDLKPFFELMADEKVLKVFHAARQDIEIVWHQAGIVPHPIFDTQVAAMVLGYGDSIAYDQLVERIAGHRPDKTHRFTDWSRRPLTEEQIHYAVSDVTHLRDVFTALDADLKKRGRSDWVSEEMEVLTSPKTYDFHPERAWERLKTRVRKPKELAVLMEVAPSMRRPPSNGWQVCARCQRVLTGRNGAPISWPPCNAASRAILRPCLKSKSRAAIQTVLRSSSF